jgi:metallophosphoesterase (TIGR00282 family)
MAKVLFLGDIVGRAGRQAVADRAQELRESLQLDALIVNGENAAGGAGIHAGIAQELHKAGVDAITLGDHVWDQRGFDKEIDGLPFVCRPYNLLEGSPGAPFLIVEAGDVKLGVVTLLGDQLMKISSKPAFAAALEALEAMREQTRTVFVEMHAETTSEKVAMGWFLDGRATAVVGTHTHIPTADARILPRGTGYITDAGMSGPYDSVLGRDIAPVIGRFVDGMPRKFTVAEANVKLCGVLFEVDAASGRCVSFARWEG